MKIFLKTLLVVGALALAFVAGREFFASEKSWEEKIVQTHARLDADDYAGAEKMARRAVRAAEKSKGAASESVAKALILLAYAQAGQGKHAESLATNLRAAEILEKREGNSPDALLLHAWESVAMARIALGQTAEALPLLRRVLAEQDRLSGADSGDVQRVLLNLGEQEFAAGNTRTAEHLALRALSLAEETKIGRGAAAQQLGSISLAQGNLSAAEENLQNALRAYAQEAGTGSLETSYVLQLLAWGKMNQGEFSSAETLLQRAKEIAQNARQGKEAELAHVMTNLAGLAWWREDFSQAEENLAEARRWLDAMPKGAAFDRGFLLEQAFALRIARDDLAGAEGLLKEMQSRPAQTAGESLPLHLLQAGLLSLQGKFAESAQLYQQAEQQLAAQESASPWDRLTVAEGLGRVRLEQGDFRRAEENFRQAVNIAEAILKNAPRQSDGKDAQLPALFSPLNGLGESLLEQGKLAAAEEIGDRAEKLARTIWGEDSLAMAEVRMTAALLQMKREENTAAEAMLRMALATCEKRLGENHSVTAFGLFRLAEIHLAQRNFSAATETAEKALAVQEKILGAKHPAAGETSALLERIRAEETRTAEQ